MNTTTFYRACVLFAVHFRFATAYKKIDYIEDPDDLYPGGYKKKELPLLNSNAPSPYGTEVTPAPTQCPVDDPKNTQDACNYEDCCNWNERWCSNGCGNIDDENATICHGLWVSIKNVCVCNYLGPDYCPDDFRAQLANTAYCCTGPDLCDPSSTPSPTCSPTALPTASLMPSLMPTPPPIKPTPPHSCPSGSDITFVYEGLAGVTCETMSFYLNGASQFPDLEYYSYSLAGLGNDIPGDANIGLTATSNPLIHRPNAPNYIFVAKVKVEGCPQVFSRCTLDCVAGGPSLSPTDPPFCRAQFI